MSFLSFVRAPLDLLFFFKKKKPDELETIDLRERNSPRVPWHFGHRNFTANAGGPGDPPSAGPAPRGRRGAAPRVVGAAPLRGRGTERKHFAPAFVPTPFRTHALLFPSRLLEFSSPPRLLVLTLALAASRGGETTATAAADPSRVPDCLRRGPCRLMEL